MPINFIVIPVIIIATAVIGSRYVKRGSKQWYKDLKKPSWTPSGKLIAEIWTFLYIVTGLAILWYWNVAVVYWMHYIVAVILLANAYLNATWNKVFFVEQNIPKAYKHILMLQGTTILATILMAIDSPIASVIMLPYIIWVAIATKITKQIQKINEAKLVRTND